MKKILGVLKSTRMAAALILVLVILCLIGILLPQIPAAYSATPEGSAWWVENVAFQQVGDRADTLEALGLFDVFRSAWFIGTVALLMLNILACSTPRIRLIAAESKKNKVNCDDAFYRSGAYTYDFLIPSAQEQGIESIEQALEKSHYSVAKEETATSAYFAGEKNKFSRWATLFVHLSLMLLLAGVIVGSLSGFRDDAFIVAEGATKEIGHGTGLSISLHSFTDSYWDDGTPKDYKSEISMNQNGEPVKTGTVRVNHPVSFHGIAIHQGFFGRAIGLSLSDAEGKVLLQDSIPLTGYQENNNLSRPHGTVTLSENGYTVVLLGSAINANDPYIEQNQTGIEFMMRI